MTTEAPAGAAPRSPLRRALVVAWCAAIAAASLAVPATLAFDPWAWLVWGREIGRWTLDTTGGPSWKPLPVAATTPLAALGPLAVPGYLVLARTAALLAVVATARLAGRLAGPVAGIVAGALLLLTPDGEPRFLRLVLEGHEAPWSAALAVAALAALLDRRPGRALLWLWLLSLLRPEAWPFLLVLVVCSWVPTVPPQPHGTWPKGTRTWWGVGALVSVPLLWFVPDWIGSGSPLHGAGTAQVLVGQSVGERLLDSLGTFVGVVPAPAWVLAGVAVVLAWRRGDRAPVALAAAAAAWSFLVIAMAAAAGYAALSRFFLPSAAVVVALAGAGVVEVVRLVRASPARRTRAALAVAAVIGVALLVPRTVGLVDVADEVADRGRLEEDLDRTIEEAGGVSALRGCGTAVVTGQSLLRSAVAWKLDLALGDAALALVDGPAVLLLESPRAIELARARPGVIELAAGERWVAFAERCTPARPT